MKKSLKERLKENLEGLNADEECIALYSNYTQAELEYNTALNEERREAKERELKALKKGKIEKAQEAAKAMLRKGYSIDDIMDITKLPVNEIKMLR